MKKPVRRRRRGIIVPLVAVLIVALLMIAAIAIDGGRIMDIRGQAKAAADASARSAAIEMLDMTTGDNASASPATIRATAFRVAAENGFANDGVNSVVTVNSPPASGDYAGQNGYIEVIIEARLARGFSRLLGSSPLEIASRSVAVGSYVPTKGSVLVLNRKKRSALAIGKGSSKLIVNGDVAVNSKNKQPISLARGSELEANNVMVSGSLPPKVLDKLQNNIKGELTTLVPATPNPFEGLKPPAKPEVTYKLKDFKTSSGGVDTYNLQPGRYTDDWKLDGNDNLNLAPGTYYLDGNKMDISGGASIKGDGVTIYSAGRHELRISSSGSIHLSPPTTGPFAGISIFKDPSARSRVTFNRQTNLDISGTIYAPASLVRFQRSSTSLGDDDDSLWDNLDRDLEDSASGDETTTFSSFGGSIVADMLKIDRNATINIQGASLHLQRPLCGLVE